MEDDVGTLRMTVRLLAAELEETRLEAEISKKEFTLYQKTLENSVRPPTRVAVLILNYWVSSLTVW